MPHACKEKQCPVHFVFHGCGGRPGSGYNSIGALNDIIMIYPDTMCWDNEGDIDEEFFNTKFGLVPTAMKAMMDRVTGGTTNNDDETIPGPEPDNGESASIPAYFYDIQDASESSLSGWLSE